MGAAATTETKGKEKDTEEAWLAMVDNMFEVGEASVHDELEDLVLEWINRKRKWRKMEGVWDTDTDT